MEDIIQATRNQISKRKALELEADSEQHAAVSRNPAKKSRTTKSSSKEKGKEKAQKDWPEYFHSLFKVFKALNTVLAFVSSRKHLATTFPVVRASVEGLLKHPLDMEKVAELKALLPDLIKFAYIPQNDLRINDPPPNPLTHEVKAKRGARGVSPDYSAFSGPSQLPAIREAEEHVLILEFADNSKGKKNRNQLMSATYTLPAALTPAAAKKLVDRRNERFSQAVDELILATPASEDPVALLQSAGRDRIPINPYFKAFSDKQKILPVPESKDRPSIESVVDEVMEQEWYSTQIVDRRVVEAKEGQIASLDPPLSDTIQQALRNSRNIKSLYSHQVTAITALAQNKHVIVSTSTASGKSVIYQVPVLKFLEENPDATAIFIYPTKALAQDQRAALEQLLCACPGLEHISVANYDGDTPQEQRAGIRESASVIFTNFDMIHMSILPHEDLWRRFLKNLKLVAVDELHYYHDLFGSHVAQVMRRFRRVCAAVGNRRTRFVSCSATISKPMQHMKNIFGVDDIVEITEDGAPSGPKTFLVWRTPLMDGQRSSLSEATGLMRFLMKRGVRVILFCKIRKVCELAMKAIRAELSAEGRIDILERVMSYRGGYSQQDRRRIEHEAFSGNLLGIIATNALELGVDIGVLDAVIMLGFPNGIANFRQQAGRAGRRARDSLAVLVADLLPIDNHYVNFPDELYTKPTDDLVVDLESKVIVEAHLQCAGYEMPLSMEDEGYFGPLTREICETRLAKDRDGWYHTHTKYLPFPAKHVALRGVEEDKYTVIDISKLGTPGGQAKVVEEVEFSRALFEIYEGAVFIHQGLTFIVREVSHDTKLARVIRADVSWITSPRDFTDVDAVQTYRIREIKDSRHHTFYGRVDVKTSVFGFYKVRNGVILDTVDLETQPWERETTGMWINVPKAILELMRAKGIKPAEAIHAAQHAFLNRFAMAADMKTECKAAEKEYKATESERKRPARLIFYDLVGKSGGVAARAFDHVSDILRDAHATVDSCRCENGCSKCVQSPSCKEGNEVCSKLGARIILRGVLDLPIDPDSIPLQFNGLGGFDTVVEATSVRVMDGVQVEPA